MKKILALILVAIMLFSFAACGGAEKADVFKIGLICLHDENSTYDNNVIQAMQQVQKELGLEDDQVLIKVNIAEDDACYNAAAELVDAGKCFCKDFRVASV